MSKDNGILTPKDKAKLECMVRSSSKEITISKVRAMSLVTKEVEAAAITYVEGL